MVGVPRSRATRPGGRQAEARRNDARVLAAAQEVFTRDPDARMAAVAEQAGVGQGSLYRRYPSKEALFSAVCASGMARMRAAAVAARDAPGDPWEALSGFLRWYLESGTVRLAALVGTFAPAGDLFALARETNEAMQALVDRAVRAGALRDDLSGGDLTLIVTMLDSLRADEPARAGALRERYLTLILQALALRDAARLPGPAPDADELEHPWRQAGAPDG